MNERFIIKNKPVELISALTILTVIMLISPLTVISLADVGSKSGTVFWDNNHNGIYDEGDAPIANIEVRLYKWNETLNDWEYSSSTYTGDGGSYSFSDLEAYKYKVEVVDPASECCDLIINTTPKYYEFELNEGEVEIGNDFGFVCLKQLTNAKSKGYWSWSIYNKKTSTWMTTVTNEDVAYINNELGTSFEDTLNLANYLVSPVYGDMKTILTQQLIATLLNLRYGYIDGGTVIYYDGVFYSIDEVVDAAKNSLSNGDRCEQEYWKDILDTINNNLIYYLVTMPCE